MNRVKSLRVALGLSQRELADTVGTSQQQVQRIESGKIATKVDMASRICAALGKPLDIVFPGAGNALGKINKEMESSGYSPDEDDLEPLRSRGIELGRRNWLFRCLFRGHSTTRTFKISSQERSRLFRIVQGEDQRPTDEVPFIVFDLSDRRIGLNLSELSYCHFLYDADESELNEPPSETVSVTFRGGENSLEFSIENDSGRPDYDIFRGIFFSMECIVSPSDRFHFRNSDEEDLFLRAADVALIEVPLWLIEPDSPSNHEETEE